MFNRSSDDPILVEQVAGQLRRVDALDVDQGQPARLFRVVTGQYLHALLAIEPLRPTVEEETQAGFLALGADAFVEIKRLVDGERVRRRVSADLLELSDVCAVLLVRSHQRPAAWDFRLSNIEEARAERRQQPFVQTRAVIVAVQIDVVVLEMREGMRAIHYRLDAARARQLADALDRIDLPAQVGDVAEMDDASARRDAALEDLGDLILTLRRNGDGDFFDDDPFAPLALPPRGEHSRVILVGGQNLVARFQIQPELADFQRLAGVARDGDLVHIAAEREREPAAHAFDLRVEDAPHRVDGRVVREFQIASHRLLHYARARTDAAVVEIDQRAVYGEGMLNLEPEVLIAGHVIGPAARNETHGVECARHPILVETRRGRAERSRAFQK